MKIFNALKVSTLLMILCVGSSSAEKLQVRKPIPDKLVVLTFDDGCASHSTFVAPYLKSLGFGATFYICDGFAFNSRKDWYMTWRQIKAMAADGFEMGNHSYGHCGGANIANWLKMEDEFLVYGCPRPTTVCWPVYHVNTKAYPNLAANGYIFGRGGHHRPYRPAVDNPFDVPSFTIRHNTSAETFVNQARQAADGKIVVFCYHGVPDLEHPNVTLDPAVFKSQMQYLKDNNYKVIAMRDLAEYIDPVKAAKLPPTVRNFKEPGPGKMAIEVKPYVAGPKSTGQVETQKNRSKPKIKRDRVMLSQKDITSSAINVDSITELVLNRVNASNQLNLNDALVTVVNGFGSSWSGPVTLTGNTEIGVYSELLFTKKSTISGTGGLSLIGYKRRSGKIVLGGHNTYTGPTSVAQESVLEIAKSMSLYNGDPEQWTPENISVGNTAELRIRVGGPDEFTEKQVSLLLKNLTGSVNNNGLQRNSTIGLAIDESKKILISGPVKDSKGPGGGGYNIKKLGEGTLQLSGRNTYTGQTKIEQGTLVVTSFNSIAEPKPFSSLGSPTNPDSGQIILGCRGKNSNCAIVYTGPGESTDREFNFVSERQSVVFKQSGKGLLKITGPFIFFGCGHDKTIVLDGATSGRGEIVTNIEDVYDRSADAVTSIVKKGTGKWVLSGVNTYTGSTKVLAGILSASSSKSLGFRSEVEVGTGGQIELNFKGEMKVGKLTLGRVVQPAGTYSEANVPDFIKGTGVLKN